MEWVAMRGDYEAVRMALDARDLGRTLSMAVLPALRAAIPAITPEQYDFDPARYHNPSVATAKIRDGLVLAVGADFERCFRFWLAHCAYHRANRDELDKRIRHDKWDELKKVFREVRSFPFELMPSATELDTLLELCNALRHGDGKGVARLYERDPSLFVDSEYANLKEFAASDPQTLTFHINVSDDRLLGLSDAAANFWDFVAAKGEGIAWTRG
jgi:hypothetical protein